MVLLPIVVPVLLGWGAYSVARGLGRPDELRRAGERLLEAVEAA